MPGVPQDPTGPMTERPLADRPIVIAASRPVLAAMAPRLQESTGRTCHFIGEKAGLTAESLDALAPEYVFLPHWSYIIPRSVHSRHECVVFHMTDLPFGRGGSPLQNLIVRGFKDTVISALRCGDGLDTGPIYMKKPLSLEGTAEEIYARAAQTIEEMIVEILAKKPQPVEQTGEPVVFQRRKPEDGNMAPLPDLGAVFDYIRMLDAEGYPRAFLETEHLRLEFSRASLHSDSVVANVRIVKK